MEKGSVLAWLFGVNQGKLKNVRRKDAKSLRFETLEDRALLSVSATAIEEIGVANPEFASSQSAVAADALSVADLNAAMENAARVATTLSSVSFDSNDGKLRVGATLTANVVPNDATANYQWFRDKGTNVRLAISGATEKTYEPTSEDVGYQIRVQATGTGDYEGTVFYRSSGTVGKRATRLTSVEIDGTLHVDKTLTAKIVPSDATANFQWYRDRGTAIRVAIPGATEQTYRPTEDDLGYQIRVLATGTGNYEGTVGRRSSDVVLFAPPTQLTSVSYESNVGKLIVGATLTASVVPSDATANYQWFRDKGTDVRVMISGATGPTYELTDADAGYQIRVQATGTGDYGGTVGRRLAGTVGETETKLTSVEIEGTFASGQTLTAKVVPSGAAVEYQWYRDQGTDVRIAIPGATEKTYELTDADVGYQIRVQATGTGLYEGTVGRRETATVVEAPTELTAVSIDGTLAVGRTLTANVDSDDATVEYQWYRDQGTDLQIKIKGATEKTYTLTAADLGYQIRVQATGTGNYEGTVEVRSRVKVVETPTSLTSVDISGTFAVGKTLRASVPDGETAKYQWYRDQGTDVRIKIEGATGRTYELTDADVGYQIRVQATGTGNYEGTVGCRASYEVVETATNLTKISIDGTLEVGNALTANVEPSDATVNYQWYRDKGTDVRIAIAGATGKTYELTDADDGYQIRVQATGFGLYAGTVGRRSAYAVGETATKLTTLSIDGTLEVGNTLTANLGLDGATATYQWYRDQGTDVRIKIEGATGKTYELTDADVGYQIRVQATGTGSYYGIVGRRATDLVVGASRAEADDSKSSNESCLTTLDAAFADFDEDDDFWTF